MPLVKKSSSQVIVPPDSTNWRTQAALLQGGTPDERWAAARALADQPEALDALAGALETQTDPRLHEAILTSLAKLNSAASFDAILRHLRSDDAQLRSAALEAMRLMPQIAVLRLAALLLDEDADIRILACELGRYIPRAAAAAALGGILATEPAVNVCAAAVDVLAEVGGTAELPQLAACAARFPAESFLNFSISAAQEQIRARTRG